MNEDLAKSMMKTFSGVEPKKAKESPQVLAMKRRIQDALKASELKPKDPNPYAPIKHCKVPLSPLLAAENEEKTKKRTNHNKRSEKYYEQIGMKLVITESFSHLTMRSKDMGGIFDGIATGNGQTRGVQICSHSSVSARRKKMQDSPYLQQFIAGGNRAFILAWKLNEKGRWIPSEIEVLPL